MSPKRKERVAPPARPGGWEVRYQTTEAVKGWDELCQQAPGNTCDAWEMMRTDPGPAAPTSRHHRLKGGLANGLHEGRSLPQWQIEVTGGARVWYLLDADRRTVWIVHAGTGHPKATD